MPIIYITGREKEYVDAVQRSKATFPVAFLEKPIKIRELSAQIDLALHNFALGYTAVNIGGQRDYITLATGDGYVKIKQSEITVIDAFGAYSKVFVTRDEAERLSLEKSTNPILTSVGIGRLSGSLAPNFYPISRSQVINVNQIQRIGSDRLSLAGQDIFIPEGHRSALLTHLRALKSR